MNNTSSRATLTSITILLSTILILSPTAFSYGFTAANKLAIGFGTGTLVCPNGLTFNNEQIQFEVNKSKKEVTEQVKKTVTSDDNNYWSIGALNPQPHTAHANNSGSIKGVHLSSSLKEISIKGSESQDNICQSVNGRIGNALKINYISITGQCNTKDTIISFTALDGKRGSFKGTIICNLIR
jgi:hypothetical protein